jgi:hypothetical protein
MADSKTFYPGGLDVKPIDFTTNADQVDYLLHDGSSQTPNTGFKFWVGPEANAPSSRDGSTLYIFTS